VNQLIDGGEERGKCLAGAGWRSNQRVLTSTDRAPSFDLRVRGRLKALSPPLTQSWMKLGREMSRGSAEDEWKKTR
jgi:hypothetical protein